MLCLSLRMIQLQDAIIECRSMVNHEVVDREQDLNAVTGR